MVKKNKKPKKQITIWYNNNNSKPAAINHYNTGVHVRKVRYGRRSTRLITIHIEHATVTERSVQTTADRRKVKLCRTPPPAVYSCLLYYYVLFIFIRQYVVICCYVIVTIEYIIGSRIMGNI